MNLHLNSTDLTIQLDWQERLWACYLGPTLTIPISSICSISTDAPEMEWYALRAPGTAIPGGFTAGTYYAKRGREFWYVTRRSDFLVIGLEGEYYKRVVLTTTENNHYSDQLNEILAAL
ncbi:MAG: hypothetical protein AAF327_08205 [Cyanobacteria bacterium P01_A01_bin.37]